MNRADSLLSMVDERLRGRFYGKYAGVVTRVDDPLTIGRIRAQVPAVLGEQVETGWALPCAPFGGGKDRGMLFLPEKGDTVWIEFAEGDVSQPIWSGCFWGAPESSGRQDDLAKEGTGSEAPTANGNAASATLRVLRTKKGHRISFEEDGAVLITHGKEKAEIRLTAEGEVVIKAEKIKLGESASKSLILGEDFMQLFNLHTHGTGVGPASPPTPQMQSSHLSKKSKTE